MFLSGSTNAEIFAVHPVTASPAHAGLLLSETAQTYEGWRQENDADHLALWNNEIGDVITWRFFSDYMDFDPQVWAVVDDAGTVQQVWEAETRVDTYKQSLCPIVQVDNADESIIPADGALIQMRFPGFSFDDENPSMLESLNTALNAASKPTWITDTRFYQYGTAYAAAVALWQDLTMRRGFVAKANMQSVDRGNSALSIRNELCLLWLRACSMILHDHRGESCVPLIMDWTIDKTNGVVTP